MTRSSQNAQSGYMALSFSVLCWTFVASSLHAQTLHAQTLHAQTLHAQTTKPTLSTELVKRNQIRLTLTGAQKAISASLEKAKAMGVDVNISVVDDGGHLLAFARMDGARPGSVYTSMTKATSAATKRGATGPLPNADSPNTHLSLAVENAAMQSGGRFTTLKGGIPIMIEDQLIGAVGVGGATGEQDAEVAVAGADAVVRAVNSPAETNSPSAPESVNQMLYGTWQVIDIDGHGIAKGAETTLQIHKDAAVSGSTAVNRYNGKASIEGNEIQFGPLAMTRRAGPPSLMSQEQQFVQAMQNVRKFRIDNEGLLRLLDRDDTAILRLSLAN